MIASSVDTNKPLLGYPDGGMTDLLKLLCGFLVGLFRSRAACEAELGGKRMRR